MKKILITIFATVILLLSCENGLVKQSHNAGFYPHLEFELNGSAKEVEVTLVGEVSEVVIPGYVQGYPTVFMGIVDPAHKGSGFSKEVSEALTSIKFENGARVKKDVFKDSKNLKEVIIYEELKESAKEWGLSKDAIVKKHSGKFSDNYVLVKYDVKFNTNGGSAVAAKSVSFNGKISESEALTTNPGGKFLGWYTDSTYTTKFDFNNEITGTTELYALWDIDEFSVTFNSNNGTSVSQLDFIEYGSSIVSPSAPTRVGFTFDAWYIDEELTNEFDFALDTITDSITLHAAWNVATPSLTIADSTVDSNKKATITIANYNSDIEYRYTHSNGSVDSIASVNEATGTFELEKAEMLTDQVVTITATSASYTTSGNAVATTVLERKAYLVNFDMKEFGSDVTKYVLWGDKASLENPSVKYYTLDGWNDSLGKSFSLDTAIKSDISLSAVWNLDIFDYTLNGAGDEYSVGLKAEYKTLFESSTDSSIPTDIVIPATYNGLPVTEIVANGFTGYKVLRSVELPESIKIISNSAFAYCESLEDFTMGNGVEIIAENAFLRCASLNNIELSNNLKTIRESAFFGCATFTSIVIPDSIESLLGHIFHSCPNLTSLSLPAGTYESHYLVQGVWLDDGVVIDRDNYVTPDRAVITKQL